MKTPIAHASMRAKSLLLAATFLTTSVLVAPAFAQLERQTGIADPGRAQQRLQEQLSTPQVTPNVSVSAAGLANAPAGAENVRFKFGGLKIEGATAYDSNALGSLYQDKIGTEISLADVYTIANNMTLKYRNDGYLLTQVVVPPQTIEGGIAKVRIVEGFIDKVVVQTSDGESAYAVEKIKQYAGQINATKPVNVRALERQLLLISDLPGVTARSVISPSEKTPGAADLLIIVERKQADAALSFDTYGSRYLGPVQFGAAGTINSWFGLNEAITAQMVVAPGFDNFELGFGSLRYEMPVGLRGTKVAVTGSVTDTTPGFDLKQFDVEGRSEQLSIQATHPFIRGRSTNLTGRTQLDMRMVQSENNVEDTRQDDLRILRAGLQYQFLDRLLGIGANVVDAEFSKGINVLGASQKDDPNMTRALADPQFFKMNLEAQRLQRITDNVNLLVEARAQIANDALPSSEEFGIGGISSVRGFDPSEVAGDDGVSGRVEAQWKQPWALGSTFVESYQLYSFLDAGRVWNDDNTTAATARDTLAGAGAGVRFDFVSDVEGGLALGFPLNRDPQTQNDRSPKIYMNLNKKF